MSQLNKTYDEFLRWKEPAIEAVTDFRKFIPLAWPIIEPGSKYQGGWHIDAIAEHLMAVSNGQIRNLLINMPPRHGKSSVLSVLWTAWEWIQKPWTKWLFSSYNQSLSVRDNLKCRRLILSPWYQVNYGNRFQLARDQKTKIRYDNNQSGYRIATSVDGGNTGEGGDRIVCLAYDTAIKVKYGYYSIGRICEAENYFEVLSYNKLRRQTEFKRILKHFVNEATDIVVIELEGYKSLEITPNHLVYTGNRGYVKSAELTPLDRLFSESKQDIRIKSVKMEVKSMKTYNIEVEGNNNYFANGVLVHNCDDGNNNKDSESQAVLESTAIWWKETMSTRLNDPQHSTRTVVAQRTNERDISGIILTEMPYFDHLCLPAEYEGSKKMTSLGWVDPRETDGQLLWQDRFTRDVIDKLKIDLGTYGTAGQLQQRPAPRGGGIIKKEWFKFYQIKRDQYGFIASPKFSYIMQSWDTAFKEGEENDFSVCLTIGVGDDGYYLINRWKDKVDFPELEKMTISLATTYQPHSILVEDKASGQSLVQCIKKRTKLPIKAVKVERDKTARMHSISPIIQAGKLFLPENEAWVQDYIEVITKFPAARHDDDVDATTQALIDLAFKKPTMPNNGNNLVIGIGR